MNLLVTNMLRLPSRKKLKTLYYFLACFLIEPYRYRRGGNMLLPPRILGLDPNSSVMELNF